MSRRDQAIEALETRIAQAVQSVVFQEADAQTALDSVADWYNNK